MLKYARLRFLCEWEEGKGRIHSPLHWREDLEMALRRVACILPRQGCGECIVKARCTYRGLFLPEEDSGEVRRERSRAPLPFALVFPDKADPSGRFTLELTLLQPWVERLPTGFFP